MKIKTKFIIIIGIVAVILMANGYLNTRQVNLTSVFDNLEMSLDTSNNENVLKISNDSNVDIKFCNLCIYNGDGIYTKRRKEKVENNTIFTKENFTIKKGQQTKILLDMNLDEKQYLYLYGYANNKQEKNKIMSSANLLALARRNKTE